MMEPMTREQMEKATANGVRKARLAYALFDLLREVASDDDIAAIAASFNSAMHAKGSDPIVRAARLKDLTNDFFNQLICELHQLNSPRADFQ